MDGLEIPSWAGLPDSSFHLDVIKGGKCLEKIPVNKKTFYLFGRNMDVVDIVTEHASCSRVHTALVFHKS